MSARWTAGRACTLAIGGGLAAVMIGFGVPPLLDDEAPTVPAGSAPTAGTDKPQPVPDGPATPPTVAIPRFGETTPS